MRVIGVLCGAVIFLSGAAARCADIHFTIDTESANAVLAALQHPGLSRAEALKIAQLPGNRGATRKSNEFKIPATDQSFANALYAAARGERVTDITESSYFFELVKTKLPALLALVREIKQHPEQFDAAISARLERFSPPGATLRLQGYVLAAGDGGGYTFGDTTFYLNLVMSDDLVEAKVTTTHELYHAIQGAMAVGTPSASSRKQRSSCAQAARLFTDFYNEASATYVEDVSLLVQSQSVAARNARADLDDGIHDSRYNAILLEESVTSLEARPAMSFDDVYTLGFLGRGPLYSIGFVMARDIVEDSGPQALARDLGKPGYRFLLQYMSLPRYGMDKEHPKLGANTVAMLGQLERGCR